MTRDKTELQNNFTALYAVIQEIAILTMTAGMLTIFKRKIETEKRMLINNTKG